MQLGELKSVNSLKRNIVRVFACFGSGLTDGSNGRVSYFSEFLLRSRCTSKIFSITSEIILYNNQSNKEKYL
jgi:hypothetical protein